MKSTLVGLLAACGMALFTVPVRAQDRPDLLEVSNSFAFTRPSGADYINVQLTDTGGSTAVHHQSVRVSHEFPGVDSLVFRIYEPDKVTRSPTLYKTQQKNFLFARILLPAPPSPYSTFSAYGIVTGCKGDAQVKTVSSGNQLKYKFSCTSADDVMNQLAIPAPLRPIITGLFGPKFAFTNTGIIP